MLLRMVAIHDRKAEAWLNPMFFQSAGQAVRSFQDAVNDKSSDFGKHPEDYALFELGTFDQRSGAVLVHVAPESLALGENLSNEGVSHYEDA